MKYKHTQIGYLMLIVFVAISLLFGSILIQANLRFLDIIFMIFSLFVIVSFGSLRVIIDKKYLRIKFGYGIYRKKFLLNEVMSAKSAKNHWCYGWGIRGWLWPKMWIYNVSGFDAVEIKMKNGKTYRIGTDEPKKLEQAILLKIR